MTEKTKTPPINWTAEDRARHKAIREQFQRDRPSLDELLASGDYVGPLGHGAYLSFLEAMHALKAERERRGLSLSDVSERSGIDPAAISRLENGKQANPTIDTILRYADALGKELIWTFRDTPSTRAKPRGSRKATRSPSGRG